LGGLWALEWAWHSAETNLRCVRSSGICTPSLNSLALPRSQRSSGRTDRRTNGHGFIDAASDPDQEYIYFIRSETLPSACYILSDETSIPFYSTSNGYKKTRPSSSFIGKHFVTFVTSTRCRTSSKAIIF